MARAMAKPTWAVVVIVVAQLACVEGLGVNWGNQASQNLHPRNIVQMLKDNNITKIKLFDADTWVVKHFAGTGIEVMLGIPNIHLESLADRYNHAKAWVKANLTRHIHQGGVDIRYVAVGNEPFLSAYNGSNLATTFPALWNIQKAINEVGLGDRIKATIPQNADVYGSGTKGPSAGDFRADIRATMKQISQFLRDNNAPFVVNIYPFLSASLNPLDHGSRSRKLDLPSVLKLDLISSSTLSTFLVFHNSKLICYTTPFIVKTLRNPRK